MTVKTQANHLKEGQIVRISWTDITTISGWRLFETTIDEQPVKPVSVGFVVNVDFDHLRIAQSVIPGDDGGHKPQVAEILVIPREVITRIEVLR